jgi:hypothetical protein
MIVGAFIEFFGEKLSKLTGKSSLACRGLLRFAIKDAGKDALQLSFSDFKNIIETYLSKRLESFNISNYKEIVGNLSQDLTKNQSVLTMAV